MLEKFVQIFKEYNKKVNLISKNDEKLLIEKHIYDSLAFNLFYSKYKNCPSKFCDKPEGCEQNLGVVTLKGEQPCGAVDAAQGCDTRLDKKCETKLDYNVNLLDIGTGGGFPAIILSVFFDEIKVSAVDSILKKIKFIEYVKNELNLKNINPICKRAEELNLNEKFDICTSRAMAELRIMLEYAIPYLKENGYFVAYKSIKAEEEIINSSNALKVLNAQIVETIEYSLPIKEENKRVLVVVRKNGATNKLYPRKNGLIIKKPL